MTAALAIVCIVAATAGWATAITFVVKWSSQRHRADKAETFASVAGAEIRSLKEDRHRLGVVVARYRKDLHELEELCRKNVVPGAVRARVDRMLSGNEDDHPDADGTNPGPVPDWVAAPGADSEDPE